MEPIGVAVQASIVGGAHIVFFGYVILYVLLTDGDSGSDWIIALSQYASPSLNHTPVGVLSDRSPDPNPPPPSVFCFGVVDVLVAFVTAYYAYELLKARGDGVSVYPSSSSSSSQPHPVRRPRPANPASNPTPATPVIIARQPSWEVPVEGLPNVPQSMICAITQDLMVDPVICDE